MKELLHTYIQTGYKQMNVLVDSNDCEFSTFKFIDCNDTHKSAKAVA